MARPEILLCNNKNCNKELRIGTLFNCPHIVCSKCGETNKLSILREAAQAKKDKLRLQRESAGDQPKKPRPVAERTSAPRAAPRFTSVHAAPKPIDPFYDREESPKIKAVKSSETTPDAPREPASRDYSALFGPREAGLTADDVSRAERYDRLLLWLSIRASGSLSTFRGACESLGLASKGDGSARVIRRLRLLGHLETSPDGQKWCIAPPRRVRLCAAPDQMFLAGARDAQLAENAAPDATFQQNGAAPSRWVVDSLGETGVLSEQLGAHEPQDVALWLAKRLPTLAQWTSELEEIEFANSASFDARRWQDGDFEWSPATSAPGFYEFWEPRDDQTHGWEQQGADIRPRQRLLRLEDGSWRRCDWYGARFAARCQTERVPVVFCEREAQFAVPYEWRWPEFYERALTLASGLLPAFVKHEAGLFLVYSGAPLAIVEACARALPLDTTSV